MAGQLGVRMSPVLRRCSRTTAAPEPWQSDRVLPLPPDHTTTPRHTAHRIKPSRREGDVQWQVCARVATCGSSTTGAHATCCWEPGDATITGR